MAGYTSSKLHCIMLSRFYLDKDVHQLYQLYHHIWFIFLFSGHFLQSLPCFAKTDTEMLLAKATDRSTWSITQADRWIQWSQVTRMVMGRWAIHAGLTTSSSQNPHMIRLILHVSSVYNFFLPSHMSHRTWQTCSPQSQFWSIVVWVNEAEGVTHQINLNSK